MTVNKTDLTEKSIVIPLLKMRELNFVKILGQGLEGLE